MASLLKRGSVYYLSYYVGGKEIRTSLDTDSFQIARERQRHFESARLRGENIPLPTRTPIADVVTAYVNHIRTMKTPKSAQTDIYYLRDAFDRAARGIHFRGAFENFHSGDPLYFLSERVGSVQEQVPVKLLHLGGAIGTLDHRLLGRRQCTVQRDDQRVPAKHHAHRFRLVAGPLPLEGGCRLSNLLRHCFRGLCHRTHFWQLMPSGSKQVFANDEKKRRDPIPRLRDSITSAYSATGRPANRDAFYLVVRRPVFINHAGFTHHRITQHPMRVTG
jgi:hypothetical protein